MHGKIWKWQTFLALALFMVAGVVMNVLNPGSKITRLDSKQEVVAYLQTRAEACDEKVTFGYASSRWHEVNDQWLREVTSRAGMTTFMYSLNNANKTVILSGIEYPAEFYQQKLRNVQTVYRFNAMTDIGAYIRQNVAARSATIVFFYDEPLDFMKDSDGLRLLLQGSGVRSYNLSVNPNNMRVEVSAIVYYPTFASCDTLEDIRRHVYACAQTLSMEIHFCCSERLYAQLSASADKPLQTITSSCGIADASMSHIEAVRLFSFEDICYYPGLRVLTAANKGNLSILTDRELSLLKKATDIASQITRANSTALSVEKAVHDYICANVTYKTDGRPGMQAGDTAIGALLDGKADCDGYSDAFFLLGTLCGLDVWYFPNEAAIAQSNGSHMANVVQLGGQWYIVDTTSDDTSQENPRWAIKYHAFNIGQDRARLRYTWRDDCLVRVPAASTSAAYYYYTSPELSGGALFYGADAAAQYIYSRWKAGDSAISFMVQGAADNPDAVIDAFKRLMDARNEGYHIATYCYTIGQDAFFGIFKE